jgi:predicted amidophosphoribosyltransferase
MIEINHNRECTVCGSMHNEPFKLCAECRRKAREHKASKKARGICASCSNDAIHKQSHCELCVEKNKQRRLKKQYSGLCINCSKPRDREGIHCTECAKAAAYRTRSLHSKLIDKGICVMCHKNALVIKRLCVECRLKKNEQRKKKRAG